MIYCRLRLGGLHPLCGIGVTSLILETLKPLAWFALIADSLPVPGPFTNTSTSRSPCSRHFLTAVSETRCAAKAVLFREPLKPTPPPLHHEITFPSRSVSVTIVLLKFELMKAFPLGTNFLSRLLVLVLDRAIKLPVYLSIIPLLLNIGPSAASHCSSTSTFCPGIRSSSLPSYR